MSLLQDWWLQYGNHDGTGMAKQLGCLHGEPGAAGLMCALKIAMATLLVCMQDYSFQEVPKHVDC